MEKAEATVDPELWRLFNFQRCATLPDGILKSLRPDSAILTSPDTWLSLELKGSRIPSRLLVRHSLTATSTNLENQFFCDMRIREILCSTEEVEQRYSSIQVPPLDIVLAQLFLDMLPDYWSWFGLEIKLPRFPVENTLENSPAPIKVLKPGSIKVMNVIVILSSVEDVKNKDKGPQSIAYIYKEVLRDCFKSYNLHVKSNTMVDLRKCSLASSICPKLACVFVKDCTIRKPETEIGNVNSQTTINIEMFHDINYYYRVSECLSSCSSVEESILYGLEHPFELIKNSFERQLKMVKSEPDVLAVSQGFLLAGPSGSGKSLLVQKISTKYCANVLYLDFRNEISSLRNDPGKLLELCSSTFAKVIHSASYMGYLTVIVLENLDVLYTNDENSKESVQKQANNKHRVVSHLCNIMDKIERRKVLPITIIGTTSKPYLFPPKLRRYGRLQEEIFIKVPNELQRIGILDSFKKQMPNLSLLDSKATARKTPGYVGADLLRLVHVAAMKAFEEDSSDVSDIHINYALRQVFPSVLQGAVGVVDIQRSLTLDQISGLQSVKEELIRAIVWPLSHPEAFLRLGITPAKGILLYGPPGCGKTTLVRALAASHHTNFLSVSSAELFSSAVGESEKIVSHLFHQARMASPCILFIDELESIVGSRDASKGPRGNSMNETILSMLLTEMDGIGVRVPTIPTEGDEKKTPMDLPRVVVVGATNRPDMIDAALLRPGRFDRMVPVPPPNEAERLHFLETQKSPKAKDVDLKILAKRTERFSGADLMNFCREAALCALAEDKAIPSVRMDHYESVLSQLSPSISEEYLRSFHEYAKVCGGSPSASTTLDITEKLKALSV